MFFKKILITFFLIPIKVLALRYVTMLNEDTNIAIRNKDFLTEVPYNRLIKKIEKHEISKIYFSQKYDNVISEDTKKIGDPLVDYKYTSITPFIANSLVETSLKNDIDTVFIQVERPSQIQQFAGETISFISNYFLYPFNY